MANQAPAKSSLFYLYVGSEWSGPFQAEQITFFRRHGQVESDTYAYDPDQQRHYTVGELLAAIDAAPAKDPLDADEDNPLVPRDLDEASTPSTTRVFLSSDEGEPEATATLGTSLDALPDPLRTFWSLYRELTEGRPADRAQTEAHLVEMASAIGIQLSASVGDTVSLTLFVGDLLRLADYLANRHQDAALWEAIEVLRPHRPETDPDEAVNASKLVVSCIVERAKRGRLQTGRVARSETPGLVPAVRDVAPAMHDSQEIKAVTDSWDQPHARTARLILRDARKELKSTEADLEAIQHAYTELQETHVRDLQEANEMLARLESARADEAANAAQALAEVRSLAAEIHRLAGEHLAGEVDLKDEIIRLADELKGSDATAMAPLAEALLIRLVTRLRNLGGDGAGDVLPADVAGLREELARVRGEQVQARAQVMVLTDERDRLRRQIEEQRAAADRAVASAREREQRLRSTVTALEVTKGLHQDVMRELEVQLGVTQRKVTEMEGELSTVRVELTNTRTHLADRTRELQEEMRRAVELRAMLEARREELSVNLRTAEAELQQAQVDQAEPGASADPELVEALAAKVNHLRTMFEATKRRLDEQEVLARKLEEELTVSRREATELRGRGDTLTTELDDARVGLSAAKKRFEELNRAYARLESERESLQQELATRKGTDSVRRGTEGIDRPTDRTEAQDRTSRLARVMEQLESRLNDTTRRLEQANAQLDSERARVREQAELQAQLQARVEDLTSDREHLRTELDRLHADHFSEHSRHAASIAVATQSTIEAERRLKEAMGRVVELEDQVEFLRAHQAPAGSALAQLNADGEESASGEFASPTQVIELRRQLDDARAEVERLRAESSGSASGQRHALQVRLAQVEAELASATASRDDAGGQLKGAVAERDRVGRELARLKNEHESAAVEHRAALKSARDKLVESQTRVQLLEKELDQARSIVPADPAAAARAEATAAERDRLADQVRSLTSRVERSTVTDDMQAVRRQLDQELERIKALTRGLSEAQGQADAARLRVAELEARAGSAVHERDTLQIEIEKLKGELLMAQASVGAARESDAGRRGHFEKRLNDVLADREQLLSELSRVNAELMQVRGRLVRAESEAIVAERLPQEQARLRELEAQVAQMRAEHGASAAALAEVRNQLAAVSAERDRLRDEVERLRAQLAQTGAGVNLVDELVSLRDKLTRAKVRIRALRKERDELLERIGSPAAGTDSAGFTSSLSSRPVMPAAAPAAPQAGSASASRAALTSVTFRGSLAARDVFPLPGEISSLAHPALSGTAALTRRPDGALPLPGAGTMRLTATLHNPHAAAAVAGRPAPAGPRLGGRMLATAAIAVTVAGASAVLLAVSVPFAEQGAVIARTWTVKAPISGIWSSSPLEGGIVPGVPLGQIDNERPEDFALRALVTRKSATILGRDAAVQRETEAALRRDACAAEVEEARREALAQLSQAAPAASAVEAAVATWLAGAGALPRERLTEAQRDWDKAHAELERADRELAAITEQVAAEQAVVDGNRHALVSDAVGGVLWRASAQPGQRVTVGDALLDLADPASVRLAVDMQRDHLEPGQPVRIRLRATGQVADGSIDAVEIRDDGRQRVLIALRDQHLARRLKPQSCAVLFPGPEAGPLNSLRTALAEWWRF